MAIGIDATHPRFSWKLQSSRQGVTQHSYRIIVGTDSLAVTQGKGNSWDSGIVESDCTLSHYQGNKLLPFTCEQNADDLEKTLQAVEEKFGEFLSEVSWLNMGGGHHITREDYDVKLLEKCIQHMKETYDLDIYLEPGEAVALNAGYLVTEVMDIVENEIRTLILDASAACHMPDVLEMPYRPPLKDSGEAGEKAYTYRLSSCTCLAGDVIGDYSFDREIRIGDKLYFMDMAIYSMVKNNTFNGMPLPDIAVMHEDGECEVIRHFGYEDFKSRLS